MSNNKIIYFRDLCEKIKKEKNYKTTRACINEINKLIEDKKIYKLSSNIYRYGFKESFKINKNEIELDIIKEISSNYNINFIIWDISVLNNWLNHLLNISIYILEVEKEYIDFVFDLLKEKYSILKNPKIEDIYNYAKENTILLKPLVSKAPINNIDKTPKIEKIIVDIFSDKMINSFYDGNERLCIYENIFNNYSVNYKTLFAYAKRRSVSEELKDYLLKFKIGEVDYYDTQRDIYKESCR